MSTKNSDLWQFINFSLVLYFVIILSVLLSFFNFRIAKCGCHIKRMHYLKRFIYIKLSYVVIRKLDLIMKAI